MRCAALVIVIILAVTPAAAFASETTSYTYDARGRLIKVVHMGSVNNNIQVLYQYDAAGNRVRVTTTGASH